MKLRDFKIGWRLLAKEPTYSSVVILGLAIAFAACFLVLSVLLFSLVLTNTFLTWSTCTSQRATPTGFKIAPIGARMCRCQPSAA